MMMRQDKNGDVWYGYWKEDGEGTWESFWRHQNSSTGSQDLFRLQLEQYFGNTHAVYLEPVAEMELTYSQVSDLMQLIKDHDEYESLGTLWYSLAKAKDKILNGAATHSKPVPLDEQDYDNFANQALQDARQEKAEREK